MDYLQQLLLHPSLPSGYSSSPSPFNVTLFLSCPPVCFSLPLDGGKHYTRSVVVLVSSHVLLMFSRRLQEQSMPLPLEGREMAEQVSRVLSSYRPTPPRSGWYGWLILRPLCPSEMVASIDDGNVYRGWRYRRRNCFNIAH